MSKFTAFCCDISDGANRPAYCSGGMDTRAAMLHTLCEIKFCIKAKILLQRVTSSDGELPPILMKEQLSGETRLVILCSNRCQRPETYHACVAMSGDQNLVAAHDPLAILCTKVCVVGPRDPTASPMYSKFAWWYNVSRTVSPKCCSASHLSPCGENGKEPVTWQGPIDADYSHNPSEFQLSRCLSLYFSRSLFLIFPSPLLSSSSTCS